MSDTSEKRASKFINRALPDLPSAPSLQTSPSPQKATCPAELNNLYEPISQSTPEESARTSNVGEMYEDIDNCLERCGPTTVSGLFNDSSSSCHSSTSRSSSLQHPTRLPPDDEYLEPVIPPEDDSSNWRPSPAPRSSISNPVEGRHQTSYVNAEMMSTELPSLDDGFAAMTEICRDALKQIADRITVQYVSASWPSSCHLSWSNFELYGDGQPQLVQQNVSYYCARHSPLAPKGCVLMVRLLYIQFLLELLSD